MATPNTIVASQVITSSGSESTGHSVIGDSLSVIVIVSAVAGTSPSATFSVQWSDDGVNYAAVSGTPDAFPAFSAVGSVAQRFTSKGAFYRLSWSITGTSPSFTTTIQSTN